MSFSLQTTWFHAAPQLYFPVCTGWVPTPAFWKGRTSCTSPSRERRKLRQGGQTRENTEKNAVERWETFVFAVLETNIYASVTSKWRPVTVSINALAFVYILNTWGLIYKHCSKNVSLYIETNERKHIHVKTSHDSTVVRVSLANYWNEAKCVNDTYHTIRVTQPNYILVIIISFTMSPGISNPPPFFFGSVSSSLSKSTSPF